MTNPMLSPWPACILPTCRSRDTHAEQADGTLVCWTCGQHLRRLIRDINAYLRHLDGQPRTHGHTTPRRPGYSSRPPANLTHLALTDPRTRDHHEQDRVPAILRTITEWARAVHQACPAAAGKPLRTIGDALITLLVNTGWITAQPNIAAYAEAITFVHNTLRRAAGDAPPPPVAHCGCGGPIWLAERTTTSADGTRERVGIARCSGCGTAYTGLDLVKLLAMGAS